MKDAQSVSAVLRRSSETVVGVYDIDVQIVPLSNTAAVKYRRNDIREVVAVCTQQQQHMKAPEPLAELVRS